MRIFIVLGILSLLAACGETEQASEMAQTPKSIAPNDKTQKTAASEVKTMGPEAAVLHHVLPRDRGGGTSWENVVTSCIRCNSRKSNRLPREAGMRLLKEPKRPARRPFVSSLYGKPVEKTWEHFLQAKR